ncbi:MAG: hypothetical protein M1834_001835 [Cirrosporium novae-zelandiae]|nr:MAG: hypothetical protein M1834_001835 [Cirrosporium novae-zelandiae]
MHFEKHTDFHHLALPSPTLTNPDLILPYSNHSRSSSTPSPPPFLPASLPSSPSITNLIPPFPNSITARSHLRWKPSPLGKDLAYAVDSHGRPLSTIEEAQSAARSRNTSSGFTTNEDPRLGPLLTSGHKIMAQNEDEDRHSSSGSSVNSDIIHWDGFDSGPGVKEEELISEASDDEDYKASGSENGTQHPEKQSSEDEDDLYSSAALSARAEQILANAKKRLSTMEGNLNRARRSFMITPSSSLSSLADRSSQSPDSPAFRNGDRKISPTLRIAPANNRQLLPFKLTSPGGPTGHGRVVSETSLPSSFLRSPTGVQRSGPRASSALGTTSLSRSLISNSDAPSFRSSNDTSSYPLSRHSSLMFNRQPTPLRSVREDDAPPTLQSNPPVSPVATGLGITGSGISEKLRDFDHAHPTNSVITRSRSSMQMRDLREQMNDLKGKISNLKERAKEDQLRRRSMQNLRARSPLNSTEQWYSSAHGYHGGPLSANAGYGWRRSESPLVTREEHKSAGQSIGSKPDARQADRSTELDERTTYISQNEQNVEHEADDSFKDDYSDAMAHQNDAQLENGAGSQLLHHALTTQDYPSPEEDSPQLNSEDVVDVPIGERHEDRADAFDYEHFFLHSALGNYSRGQERRGSVSSENSVETTRGTTQPLEQPQVSSAALPKSHQRNNSTDSISTMATFATATEGLGSDYASEDEDHWTRFQQPTVRHHIAELQIGVPSPPPRKRSFDSRRSPTSDTSDLPTPRNFPLSRASNRSGGDSLPRSGSPSSFKSGSAERTLLRGLGETDRELVDQLVTSLVKICANLREGETEGADYKGKMFRRRLHTARKILDGELDGKEP